MLVAVMLALAAYVPTCFCWTEAAAAWMMGNRDGVAAHACCGEHDGAAPGHQDGDDEHHAPSPGCLMDCVCGVQHRIVPRVPLTVLDFEPALVGWVSVDISADVVGTGNGPRCEMGDIGLGAREMGACTLLRLHCALTI